jgi:predicted permease
MRVPLWWRRRRNEELNEEIQAHLTLAERAARESGHTEKDARLAARHEFGNVSVAEEVTRDTWGWRWLEDFFQDARYAVRTLAKRPGFTVVALLMLALGIGTTTVMFTLINGVLLKPLSYQDADRLLAMHGRTPTWNVGAYGEQNVAYPDFLDCRRQSRSLEIAGWLSQVGGTVSEPGEPEYVEHREITSNLFDILGVAPLQGRGFLMEEDAAGGEPVVVLGHSFWQRRFAGSASVLGTRLVLNDKPYTIVGVVPASFRLGGDEPDILTPVGQDTAPFLRRRGPHPIGVIARLRPAATLAQAQAELTVIGRQLAAQFRDTNANRSFSAEPLRPDVGDVSATLWLLLGAVTLVLLIACANVANLLLARAVSREREFAMRMALGAGRGRLVRQCLTESGVLALCGGTLGVLLAAAGIQPFVALWPETLPRAEEVHLDWHVLIFALVVSSLGGFVFGLAPALRAPARNLEQKLRAAGRTLAGSSRRLHGAFAAVEVGLAVVLLVSAGVLGRTMLRLATLPPGVDTHNVLVTRAALSQSIMENPGRVRAAWQDLLDQALRVPGVQAVAMVDTVPLRRGNNQIGYWTSASLPPENQRPLVLASSVTPEYLQVTGIALRQGRFFDEHDRLGNQPVVVIDEVMAQEAFGNHDSLGKQLWIGLGNDPVTVVGVVGHVRYWGLAADDQAAVRAQLYYPFAQLPDRLVHRWSDLMSIVVRTGVAPLAVAQPLRAAIKGQTSDQVLYQVNTLQQLASDSLARQRFLLVLFGIFAGLALLLACIGIYGVLAYLTSQRVMEIGVRMALGATARDVIGLVLRQSLAMISLGVLAGIAAAYMAARLLKRFVPGVRSIEPWTFAAMVAVLIVAALIASFVPARRASRVDPLVALRHE